MRTTAEERERFAISTVIAVGIHLLFFLLLLGLRWPPSSESGSISPPVSLSVQLVGASAALPPLPEQPTAPVGQAPSAGGPAAQSAASSPQAAGSGAAAASATASLSAAPSQAEVAPSSSAGAAVGSGSAEGSSAGGAGSTAGPPGASIQPYYSTGTTLSSGPQGGGASAPSAERGGGAAQPGINYEAPSSGTPYPAQGGANPGSTGGPATAQVLQGSAASGAGSSINQQLVEQAGSAASASGAGGGAASAGSATSDLAGGGTGQGSAAVSGQGGAPGQGGGASPGAASTGTGGQGSSIQWENQAARRIVVNRPPDPTIPQNELAQLPPMTKMVISFEVSPSGTVRVLNISPPPAYPWLESLLYDWMGKWSFNPIKGTQVAKGELQYVIQANTAK